MRSSNGLTGPYAVIAVPRKKISWRIRTPVQSPSRRKFTKEKLITANKVYGADNSSTSKAKISYPRENVPRHIINVVRKRRDSARTVRRSKSANAVNLIDDATPEGHSAPEFSVFKFKAEEIPLTVRRSKSANTVNVIDDTFPEGRSAPEFSVFKFKAEQDVHSPARVSAAVATHVRV